MPNESTQILYRIHSLESLSREVRIRYDFMTKTFLAMLLLQLIITILFLVMYIKPSLFTASEEIDSISYYFLVGVNCLNFLQWNLTYRVRFNKFQQTYYAGCAISNELVDLAEWTNFYQRDPGSNIRVRLNSAMLHFNEIRRLPLFPNFDLKVPGRMIYAFLYFLFILLVLASFLLQALI